MIAYLIIMAAILGPVTIAGGIWAWHAGHTTEMWQQYRMEDQPRQWPPTDQPA